MDSSQLQPWVEFIANDLSLDFVNTVNDWSEPTKDQFGDVDGLAAWAAAVGLEGEQAVEALTPQDLRRARGLRDDLRRLISATLEGDACPPDAERTLLEVHADGVRHATLVRAEGHLQLSWTDAPHGAATLWRVADAALSLLRDGDLARLGQCPGCGWLFYDTSKNRSRRWCSMATCGSREKVRRYHQRHER